jgi:hypothetical protein
MRIACYNTRTDQTRVLLMNEQTKLVSDLKAYIEELKQDEADFLESDNQGMFSATCHSRVKLETILQDNGYHRAKTIDMDTRADFDAITVGAGFISHDKIDVITSPAPCVGFASEIKPKPYQVAPFKITK